MLVNRGGVKSALFHIILICTQNGKPYTEEKFHWISSMQIHQKSREEANFAVAPHLKNRLELRDK